MPRNLNGLPEALPSALLETETSTVMGLSRIGDGRVSIPGSSTCRLYACTWNAGPRLKRKVYGAKIIRELRRVEVSTILLTGGRCTQGSAYLHEGLRCSLSSLLASFSMTDGYDLNIYYMRPGYSGKDFVAYPEALITQGTHQSLKWFVYRAQKHFTVPIR